MRQKNALPESKKTPEIDKREPTLLAMAAAVDGIGLVGPGIAMSSGGCGGVTGIFGSWKRTSQNLENTDRLASSFNSLNNYVMEISPQSDEVFL